MVPFKFGTAIVLACLYAQSCRAMEGLGIVESAGNAIEHAIEPAGSAIDAATTLEHSGSGSGRPEMRVLSSVDEIVPVPEDEGGQRRNFYLYQLHGAESNLFEGPAVVQPSRWQRLGGSRANNDAQSLEEIKKRMQSLLTAFRGAIEHGASILPSSFEQVDKDLRKTEHELRELKPSLIEENFKEAGGVIAAEMAKVQQWKAVLRTVPLNEEDTDTLRVMIDQRSIAVQAKKKDWLAMYDRFNWPAKVNRPLFSGSARGTLDVEKLLPEEPKEQY